MITTREMIAASIGAVAGMTAIAYVTLSALHLNKPYEKGHRENRGQKIEQAQPERLSESIESVEHPTGLLQLIAEKSGEALAVTGNGDGSTTTNNFGNIYDDGLMQYIEGEKVPTIFVDHLPKYEAQ
jgi:hypothetical protein